MHYSWMGPVATPGYGSVPPPYPSLAAKAPFSEAPVIHQSALGGRRPGAIDALADLSGDGAVDSVRLKVHPIAGPIVEIMGSWADHGMCGFNRFQLPGADLTRRVIFGNTTYGGRPDIVFLDFSGPNLSLHDLRRQIVLSGGADRLYRRAERRRRHLPTGRLRLRRQGRPLLDFGRPAPDLGRSLGLHHQRLRRTVHRRRRCHGS